MVSRYLISAVGLCVLLALALRLTMFSPLVISSTGMEPTLQPGDLVIANHRVVPRRGRVVSFACPTHGTCVSRVVALEGDRVEFADGRLTVNLEPVTPVAQGAGEPLVLAPGAIYVVNDRREDSRDSRSWGPIEASRLEGRPLVTWLSLEWLGHLWPRPRWERSFRSIH